MNIFETLFRTTLVFISLLILTRLLGKKQVSHLTYFNYITGITIGSVAANIVLNTNKPFLGEFVGLIWWCLLTGLVGFIGLKSGDFRRLVDGQPSIVIKKGLIDKKAMSLSRLNIDALSMLLREQNIFSITDVEYAILEPNGRLTVMKKQEKDQVTKSDLNIPFSEIKYLPAEIIMDGKIITKNLMEYNLTTDWLNQQLRQQSINAVEDILYAEIQKDGSLYIQKI